MVKIISILTLFALQTQVLAATERTEEKLMNIYQGNVAVFGSTVLNHSNLENGFTRFEMNIGAKYFIMDRLALGANTYLEMASSQPTVSLLGPAAQYFFWTSDRLGAYIEAGYSVGLTNAAVRSRLSGYLGLDIFVTPSVSIGPFLAYNRFFERAGGTDYNRYSIGAALGIYL